LPSSGTFESQSFNIVKYNGVNAKKLTRKIAPSVQPTRQLKSLAIMFVQVFYEGPGDAGDVLLMFSLMIP
jgi:hypothetical protein